MSGGYSQGGASTGRSRVFDSLPYRGYRELEPWFEEFINALGNQFEAWDAFFVSADARANLLDPTYTPSIDPTSSLATATAAPTGASAQDTMLDVLAYIALGQFPLNQNLSIAERQALVAIGWEAIRRKGTRLALLRLAAAMGANVVAGWTVPPYSFSAIFSDGAPSPGWGAWCPTATQQTGTVATTSGATGVTGTGTAFSTNWIGQRILIVSGVTVVTDWVASVASGTSLALVNNASATTAGADFWIVPGASFRPWLFEAVRTIVGRFFPDWAQFGVGYSQFRAGFAAAGEPVLPSNAKLGRFDNPHFDTWSSGSPTNWTVTTTGAAQFTQNPVADEINYEFTSSACALLMQVAANGNTISLSQSATINNQIDHRVEVDYAYTNAQLLDVLTLQIVDVTNSQYWNGESWQTAAFSIPLPVSTGDEVRIRYSTQIAPQLASSTATTRGTESVSVTLQATSDGTATTQIPFTIYRCDLLPCFSRDDEEEAGGERTSWQPLVDAPGLTLGVVSGSATMIEPANYDRSAYKLVTGSNLLFPYHAALTGFGLQARTSWTNLLKGSNDFGADWIVSTFVTTANAEISPIVGEVTPSATRFAGALGSVQQANIVANPSSKSYVAGVWVKNLSAQDATIDLFFDSNTEKKQSYVLSNARGWQLLTIRHTFGVGDVFPLTFDIEQNAGGSSGIALADAFLYDVTGKSGVLYPPVVRTSVGATASTGTRAVKVRTASIDSNVLDPDLQRTMLSITRGVLQLTVVPTFDGTSQPNGVIFDVGESTTANRVVLDVSGGAVRARVFDDAAHTSTASLTLTTNSDPSSSQATWTRDTAIVIRVRWQDNGVVSLGCGDSSIVSSTPGAWTIDETAVAKYRIGCDIADANNFDGIVTLHDVLQVGGPVT